MLGFDRIRSILVDLIGSCEGMRFQTRRLRADIHLLDSHGDIGQIHECHSTG